MPNGPVDVLRQVLLFAAAYQLYRLTRGLVNHPEAATEAFRNARELIGIERTLNIFIEPSVQTFTAGQQWLLAPRPEIRDHQFALTRRLTHEGEFLFIRRKCNGRVEVLF